MKREGLSRDQAIAWKEHLAHILQSRGLTVWFHGQFQVSIYT